jgi:hypothetical protein
LTHGYETRPDAPFENSPARNSELAASLASARSLHVRWPTTGWSLKAVVVSRGRTAAASITPAIALDPGIVMSDSPRHSLIKLPCSDPVYGGNRDMMSWRRRLPFRKPFLWFTVALSSALTATGVWLNGEWTSYRNPPSVYGKIGLGDSREVVRYKLGDPPEVDDALVEAQVQNALGATRAYANPIHALPAGKTISQFNTWQYPGRGDDAHYDVYFEASTGRAIALACFDLFQPTTHYCPSLFGIAIDDSESEVIDVIGEPTRQSISEGVKILEYDDRGIVVRLSKERVYGLQLSHPKNSASPSVPAFLTWLIRVR